MYDQEPLLGSVAAALLTEPSHSVYVCSDIFLSVVAHVQHQSTAVQWILRVEIGHVTPGGELVMDPYAGSRVK